MCDSGDEWKNKMSQEKSLSIFEKYLALWVVACMAGGLILSQTFPGISHALNNWQVRGISVPIGILLFFMMYPALLNLQLEELKKLMRNPKPIFLTIISNWVIAPVVTVLLARIFLSGYDQLVISLILLGSSPCTAMVLVWGGLAKGNQEQNIINTTLNTMTIMFLYAPIVSLLTGIQNIPMDRGLLAISVIVFIGAPMLMGYLSKKYITETKGAEWFNAVYRPAIGKISIVALLTTLIVLFSLNGDVLINNPVLTFRVSIPLILGFVIVVGYNLLVTKLMGLEYREGIITVIIGSSSHFEIAIATAISLYGIGSQAALGTTMGLFWEVPIMLGLVYLGKWLGSKGFWGKTMKSKTDIYPYPLPKD
jgi:ACR3 family arsenite transporter